MDKTHETLSLALNALEQHYLEDAHSLQGKAITAIREALAQPEPVAVARVDDLERGGRVRALAMGLGLDAALYTSPQPAQPSKPLTDEEIAKIAEKYTEPLLFRVKDFARAIEAAHGIKVDA